MRKLFMLALLTLSLAPAAWAQGSDEEFPKATFFVGYSYNRPAVNDDDAPNLHGFDTQVTAHLNRYFGLKGDISGHFGRDDDTFCVGSSCTNFRSRTQLYNFLGGPEVRGRNSTSVTPFAHALAGEAHIRSSFSTNAGGGFSGSNSDTRFALALGGGIDVRANDRIDIRAVQVDYNPIFLDGGVSHGLRVSVGVVFK